ncbi:MAG: hypothetical protein WD060_07685 [Pirellulales bacterium]
MTSLCLKDRRIGELETLHTEIAAWSKSVNDRQRAVDWQLTIEKASIKLKRLYPKIEPGRGTSSGVERGGVLPAFPALALGAS